MANWLQLDRLELWPDAVLLDFQYDAVSDADIEAALADEANIALVNPDIDWEDDEWLAAHTGIPERRKHAYRVAALVRAWRSGQPMRRAIDLDTFLLGRCRYGIGNGHHRIRALQFLKVPAAPFALGGHVDALERLVKVAGTEPPAQWAHLFCPELLVPEEFDIVCPAAACAA